jgi:NHL repeat
MTTSTLNNVQRKLFLAGDQSTKVTSAGRLKSSENSESVATAALPMNLQAMTLCLLAGGLGKLGAVDGISTAARFNVPTGIVGKNPGDLYVVDTFNHTIRKIAPDRRVSTLAGKVGVSGFIDGASGAARFHYPRGLGIDHVGNLYVADTFNHTIRKVNPAGVVTTLAGIPEESGCEDGTSGTASFCYPRAITVDKVGNVFVADSFNHTVRKIIPTGLVSTLAGTAGTRGASDGLGHDTGLYNPQGLTMDSAENLYLTDTFNHTVRKITPSGEVTTLAGTAGSIGSKDGMGTAASFNNPTGITCDGFDNLYVADTGNSSIRRITPEGAVSTLIGYGGQQQFLLTQRSINLGALGSLVAVRNKLYVISDNAVMWMYLPINSA